MRSVGVENFSKIVNESGLGECAGHENSAGIVIPKENFDKFKAYIETQLISLDFTPSVDVSIGDYKEEPNFKKILNQISLDDVYQAIKRAKEIRLCNECETCKAQNQKLEEKRNL